MKLTVNIDPDREEETIVYAKRESDLTKRIRDLFSDNPKTLMGFRDGEIVRIDESLVLAFFTERGHVVAMTEDGKFRLRERLYEIEEMLGEDFVRLNQSCIARISGILRFEVSYGGALRAILKNGHSDYVSRRQLKAVKTKLGL